MCIRSSAFFYFVLAITIALSSGCSSKSKAINKRSVELSNLEISTADNQQVRLQDLMGKNGLIIISHRSDCPIVRRYSSEVENIRKLLTDKNINIIYLNSAGTDSHEKIATHVQDYKVMVPVYRDSSAKLTKGLRMERTSEAVFLTPYYETVYQGAIDDSLDYESGKLAQSRFLLDAVVAYQLNRPVSVPRTEARGCIIE